MAAAPRIRELMLDATPECIEAGDVAHIQSHRDRVAACALDPTDHGARGIRLAVIGQDDPESAARAFDGGARTNPTASAGDDDDFHEELFWLGLPNVTAPTPSPACPFTARTCLILLFDLQDRPAAVSMQP